MTTVPILLYHSVSADPPGWIADLTVSPRVFTHHADLIVDSGRTPMTVSGLRAALDGYTELPRRPVVVTFDDGFADFSSAAATLAERGIPSTLYVTTGALGGRGPLPADMVLPPASMLRWSQLGELEQHGVEIGGHTHTPPRRDPALQTSPRGRDLPRGRQFRLPLRVFVVLGAAISRSGGVSICMRGDQCTEF